MSTCAYPAARLLLFLTPILFYAVVVLLQHTQVGEKVVLVLGPQAGIVSWPDAFCVAVCVAQAQQTNGGGNVVRRS
jgi:hypothetical protein